MQDYFSPMNGQQFKTLEIQPLSVPDIKGGDGEQGRRSNSLRGRQQDCQDHRNKASPTAETVASGINFRVLAAGGSRGDLCGNCPAPL